MQTETDSAPGTTARLIHRAGAYDVMVWLYMLGREDAFRQKVLDLAHVQSGEALLDIGSGTGTLAIAAKKRVGSAGRVSGVDASPEMVARASKKARKARAEVRFAKAAVETLPFPDASFDVVLSTLMLHHLPRKVREACAREVRRVLKPRGRMLIVDFGEPQSKRGLLAHFHRHGYVSFDDVAGMLRGAGFTMVDSGALGMRSLQFVLAVNGGPS